MPTASYNPPRGSPARMVQVSNADRVVFPEVGRTKGDVVAYYERIAPRLLPHVLGRPLSIRRYPKGLAAPGFFQKNVPAHYPSSIRRFAVPRSTAASKKHPRRGAASPDVTVYPVVLEGEHLAYLANQGAIELHVPTRRVTDGFRPDRIVIDLDPPEGALVAVRRAAKRVREALDALGLATTPVATGSKGYHVVAVIAPRVDGGTIAVATQKVAALLAAHHPEELTVAFRTALRGGRVFIDWMRNNPGATVVAPYSLRARPRASVAAPLRWEELDAHAPDAFTMDDVERLRDRPDPFADAAASPQDPAPFVSAKGS
ncbi:MAG TPA: non-homologous end-joining DNA ligase, partial [Polyangiaceae bacterium]|nr:non-homologous end-joining DNA ligase [Polyangiaceae bacterium]